MQANTLQCDRWTDEQMDGPITEKLALAVNLLMQATQKTDKVHISQTYFTQPTNKPTSPLKTLINLFQNLFVEVQETMKSVPNVHVPLPCLQTGFPPSHQTHKTTPLLSNRTNYSENTKKQKLLFLYF